MNINNQHYHSIWLNEQDDKVYIIDQRFLPHQLKIECLSNEKEAAIAIKEMHVRGAPLIGATAAFGYYLAACEIVSGDIDKQLRQAYQLLANTRPTAYDLFYALDRMQEISKSAVDIDELKIKLLKEAVDIKNEIVDQCHQIGVHGAEVIAKIAQKKAGAVVNILTHCNAGWLATVDYGTALAPIFVAHDQGIKVHVWVDETRPRNQGARLTAFELIEHGIPHTVIADNTGGHLMQHGMVDMVITGSDRTTRAGDVANKIGTYLKALAANDNAVPFYAALPYSTIDWSIKDGVKEIPIEQRGDREVKYIQGKYDNKIVEVLLTPEESPAANYAFDVTPARLVKGIITERGVCEASEEGLLGLYPEKR